MTITRALRIAARVSADVSVIASGKPKRIARRARNHIKGRALSRIGFWRFLWK